MIETLGEWYEKCRERAREYVRATGRFREAELETLDPPRYCPKCNRDLQGAEIYEYFLELYSGDKEKAMKSAENFGYANGSPVHFSNLIGIETRQYDGVTWWKCPECGYIWKRFPWSDESYLDKDEAKCLQRHIEEENK